MAIERLELSTLALLARCSNRLSYTAFNKLQLINGKIKQVTNESNRVVKEIIEFRSLTNSSRDVVQSQEVAIKRLELWTLELLTRCSNRLSYTALNKVELIYGQIRQLTNESDKVVKEIIEFQLLPISL